MANEFDNETYEGELDRIQYWNYHVCSWLNRPRILNISYEEMINSYLDVVGKIAKHLGFDHPKNVIDVRRNTSTGFVLPRLAPLSGLRDKLRRRKVYRTSVKFRKGSRGDYKEHFSQNDLQYFNEAAGDALTILDY